MKRFWCLILALCMILSLFVLPAHAAKTSDKSTSEQVYVGSLSSSNKVYNCSFCNNYVTKSYWAMYRHAFSCSYANSFAYSMGWNVVLMILGKVVGL